jgi:hypothetical protein
MPVRAHGKRMVSVRPRGAREDALIDVLQLVGRLAMLRFLALLLSGNGGQVSAMCRRPILRLCQASRHQNGDDKREAG